MDALFVVRVWEATAAGDGYRFTVEHVGTRMRKQLASTAELIAFFEAVLREEHEAGEVAHAGAPLHPAFHR